MLAGEVAAVAEAASGVEVACAGARPTRPHGVIVRDVAILPQRLDL